MTIISDRLARDYPETNAETGVSFYRESNGTAGLQNRWALKQARTSHMNDVWIEDQR